MHEEQCVECEKWFDMKEIYLNYPHTDTFWCKHCYFDDQPERLKRSDTEDWGNPITL